MRNIKYFAALLLTVSAIFSCYEDKSKLADKPISEIKISNDAADTINIYFNESLSIKATIESEKNVTYEWGYGEYKETKKTDFSGKEYMANTTVFKPISSEKDFEFTVRELGHYMVREMVTNEDGSSMKYHHVFVNSPFEEGFMIMGRKPNGKGSLAFLKTLTPEEIAAGMKPNFRQNVYQYVNGVEMYDDPIDCHKIGSSIYLLSGETRKLVQINAKTLQHELEYDFKYYASDFIPTSMVSYDGKFNSEIFVMSKNGGCAQVQLGEQSIFPFNSRDGLPKDYKFTKIYGRPSYFASTTKVFIGEDDNVIAFEGVDEDRDFGFWPCHHYFRNRKILHVFQNEKQDGNNVYVVNQDNGSLKITGIDSWLTNLETGEGLWVLFERTLSNPTILTHESKILVNDLYTFVCFSHKNEIFKWNYTQNDLPAKSFIKLPEGEIVKSMNHYVVSRNESNYINVSKNVQTQVYVATYNPDRASEFKGSLYIFDVVTGAEVARYEGICDEPVKLIYKIK